jgi:DnaK suppressor protein
VEVRKVAAINAKQIKIRLTEEKKHIEDDLFQLKAPKITDERREGSPFGKREEEATEAMEFEKRLALENRLQTMLIEVDRALQKLEDGTYGICDVCNNPIDPARMEVLPQAIQCMSCRQKSKNGK